MRFFRTSRIFSIRSYFKPKCNQLSSLLCPHIELKKAGFWHTLYAFIYAFIYCYQLSLPPSSVTKPTTEKSQLGLLAGSLFFLIVERTF